MRISATLICRNSMHMPIVPEATNGLKAYFALSKKPSAIEIFWCEKLRPICPHRRSDLKSGRSPTINSGTFQS